MKTGNSHKLKDYYIKKADLFKVVSNPIRLEILNLISEKEMTVDKLSAALGIRKSNTSQHLAIMRHMGIVSVSRIGRNAFYKITDKKAEDLFLSIKESIKK